MKIRVGMGYDVHQLVEGRERCRRAAARHLRCVAGGC